ncbi:hypothetical protein QQ045_026937 [Rhodiola kirilowii]
MASSSGNSSASLSNQLPNSGSEGDLNQDQRKRKRMLSNRESARRSRMRKQQHLDGLVNQVNKLKEENSHIMTAITITTQKYLNVESESSILRAQMAELSHRLQSLSEIANFINSNTSSSSQFVNQVFGAPDINYDGVFEENGWFTNPLNTSSSSNNIILSYFNQHMVASADIFQC